MTTSQLKVTPRRIKAKRKKILTRRVTRRVTKRVRRKQRRSRK